jgi:putative DNA primase/helicase
MYHTSNSVTVNSAKFLSKAHEEHIAQRGLLNAWARATCRSISAEEASLVLGYTAKSGGILIEGDSLQSQFKPDKPWKYDNQKVGPKYRTPATDHGYDAILPAHPTDKSYWELENLKKVCYQINGHPCLLITEGGFKAIAGCSNDIPTVGLIGVEMGLTGKKSDTQSKRYLVEFLEKCARAGIGFIIIFDADAKTNPNVRKAERKLCQQLVKFDVDVYTATGAWEMGVDGANKGMDDFIQNEGIEAFRAILAKAKLFDADSDDESETPQTKPPTPRQTARQLAEDYGHLWKFDNETKSWRIWNGKHWEPTDDGNVETLVKSVIDARSIAYKGFSYIADTIKLLTADLRVKRWNMLERARYIAFDNLVLDTETGKTLEHAPNMGFTSCLPYVYKPYTAESTDAIENLKTNCPNIYQWMNTAMQGDRKKIIKLLAVVNGLLKFKFFDLQMFVHLIGKPGSGKGTFIRLLQKIVGRDNWKGCKLRALDDGSTMASIINKQLVSCPDERNASGVEAILSLTGGDAIGYREVYKPASDAFFYGLLIICSNHPIFVGDTTGLDRRLCLIHFDNPLPTVLRNSQIEAAMDAEISQLITASLTLTDSEASEAIRGSGTSQIAEFRMQEWEMKIQTNSVAAHFDDWLIADPGASTPTGKIYEHYKNWCSTGLKAVSHIKYPKILTELCNDYLELTSVKWEKQRGRSFFKGLRLRSEGDLQTPTHSDLLQSGIPIKGNDGVCEENDGVCAGFVRGSKALPVGNYSEMTGFESQDFSEKSNLLESSEQQKHFIENVEKPPQTPSNPVKPQSARDSNPAQTPSTSNQTPSALAIGQKVKVSQKFSGRHQLRGKSAQIIKDLGSNLYQVKFEGAGITVSGHGKVKTANVASGQLLTECECELIEFIQTCEDAAEALDIQKILTDCCDRNEANRTKVWGELSTAEQSKFKSLITG